MSQQRVAVVTGANRGIGLEIASQFARLGMQVVLTSRDEAQGRAEADKLAAQGLAAAWYPLDVTDYAAAASLQGWLEREYGRVDVLVNNAGILVDGGGLSILDLPLHLLQDTLETNFLGVLRLCQALVPMMRTRDYGRVVNISSGLGQLADMGSGTPAYRISKTAVNAVTRILAAELADTNVKVNAMCPGWVRTGIGGPNAPRSVAEGADTAVWLATLPDDGPSGGFFRDRAPIPW